MLGNTGPSIEAVARSSAIAPHASNPGTPSQSPRAVNRREVSHRQGQIAAGRPNARAKIQNNISAIRANMLRPTQRLQTGDAGRLGFNGEGLCLPSGTLYA